jgi:hypothetical protein
LAIGIRESAALARNTSSSNRQSPQEIVTEVLEKKSLSEAVLAGRSVTNQAILRSSAVFGSGFFRTRFTPI